MLIRVEEFSNLEIPELYTQTNKCRRQHSLKLSKEKSWGTSRHQIEVKKLKGLYSEKINLPALITTLLTQSCCLQGIFPRGQIRGNFSLRYYLKVGRKQDIPYPEDNLPITCSIGLATTTQ